MSSCFELNFPFSVLGVNKPFPSSLEDGHSLSTLCRNVPFFLLQYPPPGFFGGYVGEAPVNLIYVWDGSGPKKSKHYSEEINLCLAFANTGFISQNVYLYCASEGLVTVVRLWFDKPVLEKKMKLQPEQYATLVQSVGYP